MGLKIHREEKWKYIKGYENDYKISNSGKIKSIKKKKYGRKVEFIKTQPNQQGYRTVGLTKNGIQKTLRLGRLVAIAFIPNPFNKKEVNHKDFNKSNDTVENLEWVTPKENIRHCHLSNRANTQRGEKVGTHKLTEKQVKNILKMRKKGLLFREIGKLFNVHLSTIQYIANGRNWKHLNGVVA